MAYLHSGVLVATVASAISAHGGDCGVVHFSIDTTADALVTVDPVSGAISEIGPLGVSVSSAELVNFDGALYMVDALSGSSGLYVVDEVTGSATHIAGISIDGAAAVSEAMTVGPDGVVVAASPGSGVTSRQLGLLDVSTGAVTVLSTVEEILGDADVDGLGYDPITGSYFAVNAVGSSGYAIAAVDITTGAVGRQTEFPPFMGSGYLVSLTFDDGSFWAPLEHFGGDPYAVRVCTGNSSVELCATIGPLDPARQLHGFAAMIICDCPADLSGDGTVGFDDVIALLSAWGDDGPGAALSEPFEIVTFTDLAVVLASWGDCEDFASRCLQRA